MTCARRVQCQVDADGRRNTCLVIDGSMNRVPRQTSTHEIDHRGLSVADHAALPSLVELNCGRWDGLSGI